MRIIQSRSFERKVRSLPKRDKQIPDGQVRKIARDPGIGQEKRGELRGVCVHKFKIHSTQSLLSYRVIDPEALELIMLGPHESYYRDLTSYLKTRQ